jgi:ceramide glucosyltransferase
VTPSIDLALLILAIASAFYLAIAVVRTAAFLVRPVELASEFLPSMSVLKPIAGLEPDLYENLRSACDQDYDAAYEVLLSLHSVSDSAMAVARRLAAEFPSIVRIAAGENTAMLNPKIANLAKAGAEPHGEIVVIADSDIRTGRDYLRALASSFATEKTGAATCLYRGTPNASISSRLGAMQIEEIFIPSVLVALALGKLRFCLGATMAVRAGILEAMGGLTALGDTLADDHKLGELVTAQTKNVDLSRYVVSTSVAETTLTALWAHELRWARTNLALAPIGYAFSFLMYALPWAIVYLAVSRNLPWGIALIAVTLGLRVGLHYLARAALGVVRRSDLWLVPLRDFLSLAIWFASLFGRTVRWRGKTFALR